VTRAKGHDILLSALGEIADLDWRCTCAGTLVLEPDFVAGLRDLAARSGIGDRVRFTGPLAGDQLDAALLEADLLVSASRYEAYGMGVTEALAHAVPVVVSDVGGHPEAVAGAGVLVPPDDPDRLADALRHWLESPDERSRLQDAATARRATLEPWAATAQRLAEALDDAVLNQDGTAPVSPT
jgi:glycosyltransferase involved in cell wall biosynthesis